MEKENKKGESWRRGYQQGMKAGLEAGKHIKIEQHKLDIEFERSQARQKVIAEIVKLVEGMKWKGNPELETNQDFGRNEALQKVIDCLKK